MTASVPTIATVQFHGHDLITVQRDGDIYVAIKPIVEAIGLGWGSQYNRILRNEVLKASVFIMKTVAADGKKRELVCLPLKLLNGWLFGVEVGRVKPELRERILAYQAECYDVLHAYWTKGEAINPRGRPEKTRKALPGGLTIEQQDAIKALVKSRVDALPKALQAKAAVTLWSSIKSKFDVPTYKALPPEQFSAALSLVARVPLEGEHLPRAWMTSAAILSSLCVNADYGSAPTAPLPEDVRKAVDEKAWTIAKQAHAMAYTYMLRGIAWSSEAGSPRHVIPERARAFLNQATLEDMMLYHAITPLRAIGTIAKRLGGMAQDVAALSQAAVDDVRRMMAANVG